MTRWEHKTLILTYEPKGFSLTRKRGLRGLNAESVEQLKQAGREGWELVATEPIMGEGAQVYLAFMKRPLVDSG